MILKLKLNRKNKPCTFVALLNVMKYFVTLVTIAEQ